MKQYHELLRHLLTNGTRKATRAKLHSTGTTVDALSVFGHQTRYDLTLGFPLVTTKKVSFDAIAHELIWFLKGSTNIRYLKENKVSIWDEWADDQGELGPIYGAQWRNFGGIDQIQQLLDNIKLVKIDPNHSAARRLLVSAWNPPELSQMALPPCHAFFQFMVTDNKLSCQLYQRSQDVFLGNPYNVASYALLTHIIAHLTGLQAGDFVHTFGDLHLYVNHLDQVKTVLEREPYPLPQLVIDPTLCALDDLQRKQLTLLNYQHHPVVKGEVAV